MSGGGSPVACRACNQGLTAAQKGEMRAFCEETVGQGIGNEAARKKCVEDAEKDMCKEVIHPCLLSID